MKILINAIIVKKISGGVFQISYNFIRETLNHPDVDWYYLVSSDLDMTLRNEEFEKLFGIKYFVFPTQPDILGSYWKVRGKVRQIEELIKPDLVYSICAPSFFKFKSVEVMRCTNPWVTHPNSYARSTLSLKNRLRYFAVILNEKIHLKKCKYFITQTQTCKDGIIRVTGVDEQHVKVVPNVLPAIFKTMDTTPIEDDSFINIACVGAPYPHKNFDILPDVLLELKNNGKGNILFHTTIPIGSSEEKKLLKRLEERGLDNKVCNHGRISQKELGEMYRKCQLCFLPTLLEVFSASTVEALFFQLPIIATDFDFNKEVLGDSCLYYLPKNAKDAARQICRMIDNKALQDDLKIQMQERLKLYGDYNSYFNETKDFLTKVAQQ